MKSFILSLWALVVALSAEAAVSLDSCRNMALANNRRLLILKVEVTRAGYQRQTALAAYLPALDIEAGYVYNQKNLALIGEDAKLPTMVFDTETGTYRYDMVTNAQGVPVSVDGNPIPNRVAILPKSALTYDIHNVFAGAITLTQPVYMGGKIRAMYAIARYAEELSKRQYDIAVEDVIYGVDVAYWQVVSMKEKVRLARSYVALLDTLSANVNAMMSQGVATKAEALSVAVKRNEAGVDLLKVENGLSLSRMQLAQVCGLPADSIFTLEDENREAVLTELPASEYNLNDVYARRNDVSALNLAIKVREAEVQAARSSMLPQIAVVGAYSVTNPNSFNGFKNEFGGMFSVGVSVKVPLWHWGGNYNKYRAAKTEVVMGRLELEDAKEKIALQVNRASCRMQEAVRVYAAACANIASAEENLRMAQAGFREGVLAPDDVMTAQTAWLKAGSEVVDAVIDVRLCDVYLAKVLGDMNVGDEKQ